MILSLIFAFAQDRNGRKVIGAENKIPWRSPTDLKRFKDTTTGSPLIMGRKTHESIGRVLPGRQNVIITRDKDFHVPGAYVAHSVPEALKIAREFGTAECFVAGGSQIYEQTLPLADRLYITEILEWGFVGDAYFPELNLLHFRRLCTEEGPKERFEIYQRTNSPPVCNGPYSGEDQDHLFGG